MQILLILNDPPYGTERCYNVLRLALALIKSEPASRVTVFLMADAVVAAKAGQKTPDGYYNVERMLKGVVAGKGQILLCGTCMAARGLTDAEMMAGGAAQQHGGARGGRARGRQGPGVLSMRRMSGRPWHGPRRRRSAERARTLVTRRPRFANQVSLVGRDVLGGARGLAGDELEVVAGREVNDRAAHALDVGIALGIDGIYPAAMMTTGRRATVGGPPFPPPDVTKDVSLSCHSIPSGLARQQAWSNARSRVSRLSCSSASIRAWIGA